MRPSRRTASLPPLTAVAFAIHTYSISQSVPNLVDEIWTAGPGNPPKWRTQRRYGTGVWTGSVILNGNLRSAVWDATGHAGEVFQMRIRAETAVGVPLTDLFYSNIITLI